MCGSKGDPLPPLSKKPSSPKKVEVIQNCRTPVVHWQAVLTFSDGRKIPVPRDVKYEVIINFGKKKERTGKNYFIDHNEISPKEKRCYSVRAIYSGIEGGPSETVCTTGETPPNGIPKLVNYKEGDGFIELDFDDHNLPIAIFVNKSYPFINVDQVLERNKNIYRIQAKNNKEYVVRYCFIKGSIRGKISPSLVLTPQDRTPPKPPGRAVLIRNGRGCTLVWEPSTSRDVKSYTIFWDGKKETVAGDLVYYYFDDCPEKVKIVAVDKAGNVSKPEEPEVVR